MIVAAGMIGMGRTGCLDKSGPSPNRIRFTLMMMVVCARLIHPLVLLVSWMAIGAPVVRSILRAHRMPPVWCSAFIRSARVPGAE
ncbi:MAG: hypothetical protein H2052_16615 [Sphingosinicella sp.]|nr:hypothetical protein [Sphingosinicella sp.]